MKVNKRYLLSSLWGASIVLTLVAAFAIQGALAGPRDHLTLKGTITVSVNGKVLGSNDAIIGISYDWIMCKVWNDTNSCAGINNFASNNIGPGTYGCSTYTGAGGTPPPTSTVNNFRSKSMCNLTDIALSADSSTPQGGPGTFGATSCPTTLTANGLAPKLATTSHVGESNSITLSASWTFSGASQVVNKACLFSYDDKLATGKDNPASFNPFAVDILPSAPITLTTGTAISLQWTFTF